MKHVYWHNKLVSPSLHHPLTFGFFGYITWQAFLDMQPPAGPSHTALSKTVHSDIGHRRKWRLCACVQVCACVCILPETMNGCIVSWWTIMHAVCVYARQVHTVSVLWRTAWICYHCTPCVFLCTFVTVKSRWSNKIINTRGILSTT